MLLMTNLLSVGCVVGKLTLGPRLGLGLDGVDLGLDSGEDAPSVLACLERVVREDAPSLAVELGALRLVAMSSLD